MARIETIPKVIIACCVLHNICIAYNDLIEIENEECESDNSLHVDHPAKEDDRREGQRKRENIADSV